MHTVAIGVHICVAVRYWCAYLLSECMCAYTRKKNWWLEISRRTLCLHSCTVSGLLWKCSHYVFFLSLLLPTSRFLTSILLILFSSFIFYVFLAVHLVCLSFFQICFSAAGSGRHPPALSGIPSGPSHRSASSSWDVPTGKTTTKTTEAACKYLQTHSIPFLTPHLFDPQNQ